MWLKTAYSNEFYVAKLKRQIEMTTGSVSFSCFHIKITLT